MPRLLCFALGGSLGALSAEANEPQTTLPVPVSEQGRACDWMPGHRQSCRRVFMCLGERGTHFKGIIIGDKAGLMRGKTSDADYCTGAWRDGSSQAVGKAVLRCSNGMHAEMDWALTNAELGTLIGQGEDSDGRPVKIWANIETESPPHALRTLAEMLCGHASAD